MSSYMYTQEVKLIEDKEYSAEMERKYHEEYENVPEVRLIKNGEYYTPQYAFDWFTDIVEVKRTDELVLDFEAHYFQELRAIDENDNVVWIPNHDAAYEDCWDGHYTGPVRGNDCYYTKIYDKRKKIVKKYKCVLESVEPMSKYDFEEKFNQKVSDDDLLTLEQVKTLEKDIAIKQIESDEDEEKINSFLRLDDELKHDKDILCTLLGLKLGDFGKYSEYFWNDKDFVRLASNYDVRLLECASKEIRSNKEFISELMQKFEPYQDKYCPLKYATISLRDDKEFVSPYIKIAGYLLEYLSPRLKKDEDICVAAMRNCPGAMCDARAGEDFIKAYYDGKLTKEDFTYWEAYETYEGYLYKLANEKK